MGLPGRQGRLSRSGTIPANTRVVQRRVFRAPGRVNLIGDHTDYNDGFVMPMALQLETRAAVLRSEAPRLRLQSSEAGEAVSIDLTGTLTPRHDWTDYVAGVAHVMRQHGVPVTGADILISSTVPQGAGLSSSAALEVASALALLGDDVPDRLTIARWCQQAENDFVGARCGIMDQYVSCFGQRGHALLIDCRELTSRALPIPPTARVVVSNTMVKHSIAGGEYNVRRQQCEDAVSALRVSLPHVKALRDVTPGDLEQFADTLAPVIRKRAHHVVSENARVLAAADALDGGDLDTFGRLMGESHRSLRDDFEVSAPELDLLVDLAQAQPGVYGSRMTGGGFGGSTVTLVDALACDDLLGALRAGYADATGRPPEVIVCVPSDGAGEVSE